MFLLISSRRVNNTINTDNRSTSDQHHTKTHGSCQTHNTYNQVIRSNLTGNHI